MWDSVPTFRARSTTKFPITKSIHYTATKALPFVDQIEHGPEATTFPNSTHDQKPPWHDESANYDARIPSSSQFPPLEFNRGYCFKHFPAINAQVSGISS